MLKSYLKLATRNLWKRKSTTLINVFGLAIGLACCALVFLYFQHELSFDRGFDNRDDIYRVTSDFEGDSKAPTVGLPYAKYLKSGSVTDYAAFKGRNHFVLGQPTWREDADYILDWIQKQ